MKTEEEKSVMERQLSATADSESPLRRERHTETTHETALAASAQPDGTLVVTAVGMEGFMPAAPLLPPRDSVWD